MRKRSNQKVSKEDSDTKFEKEAKKQAAMEAMANRGKKTTDPMQSYYGVLAGFTVICVLAILITLFSPKQKFAEMKIIDESQILIHNGQGHQFKHGENKFFEHKTLADVKSMFTSALSDTNNIGPCKTSKNADPENPEIEEMEIELPEAYDWREEYPQCVQVPVNIGANFNCSSSYAFTSLSVVQDKICMSNNQTMQLSAQEIIDCDGNQFGCEGGYVNKVLNFGKKKGFIQQDCMEYNGKKEECGVEHFEVNECRVESQIWKVNDYCIAIQEENIKRELFKNGPVIAQMQPFTDFLAYKEGSYHRTQESFKFNGYHIVKIVGYQQSIDGSTEWIVENTWGEDWGEGGYVKMMGGKGDTQIDLYSLGVAVIPYSMYDYQSMQQSSNAVSDMSTPADEPTSTDDDSNDSYAQEDLNPEDYGIDEKDL